MLCNPVSYYPNKIDEMIFFQDNNLEKVNIMNHYNNLIAQGKYSEASDYINQQEVVYGFFADFFNLIENRIYNLQSYLLTKEKVNPFIFYNEKLYFPVENITIFSDIDEVEPLESIKLFSDDNFFESLEAFVIINNDNEMEPIIGKMEEEIEPSEVSAGAIWI